LYERIIAGRCVLFLGSDVSPAVPGREEMAQALENSLGERIQRSLCFPWAAQCYELKYGRPALISFLEEQAGNLAEPPDCYRAVAALPFRLIVSSNYDTLLEETLKEDGVSYHRVFDANDLRDCHPDKLRLVKPYGCVTEKSSLVITEGDQYSFLDKWARVLDALGAAFLDRDWLFIGCDLMDVGFRCLYRDIVSRIREMGQSAYTVQNGIPNSLARYWVTQGVTIIEGDAVEWLNKVLAYKETKEEGIASLDLADPLGIETVSWTETGPVRPVNQDCVETWRPSSPQENRLGHLFIVADGMGGHSAGEVASRLAVDTVIEEYTNDLYADIDIPSRLTQAIEASNRAIHQQAKANPSQRGMGTTVTAAVVRGHKLYVANVGDSRAYLIRGERIEQITLDHSFVAEEIRAGRMPPEEAANHPQRNLLTRVVGIGDRIDVDVFQRRLEPGDSIVLCSDGLSEYVADREIQEEVTKASLAASVKRMAQWASARGGSDNISVIVVKVSQKINGGD
jgi:protein phosphatase